MIKQVIVLRRDLNMRLGKSVAQGAHASMMFLAESLLPRVPDPTETFARRPGPAHDDIQEWFRTGMTKICVGVPSETEFHEIAAAAGTAGLPYCMVMDAGRTEFHGEPTLTALAIGPAKAEDIDRVTGHLRLL